MTATERSLASEQRLRWLVDRLDGDGAVSISDAADALDVSAMTIRRDLGELEARGQAKRVRGGAQAIGPQPFAARSDTATRAKAAIAAKVADLLPRSGVIALDASSTVQRIARRLEAARDLTVLTNGPDTFAALGDVPGLVPLLTGGQLDLRTGSLVGPLACRSAQVLRPDVLYLSAAGLDPAAGTFESTLEEAEVKRHLAAGADEVVVAADSTKLGARATALGLPWADVDLLVTDLDPDDPRLDPYRDAVRLL
ncbi:MAG: DeoR/GlpR transcriptional regulator [Actinobacteria bacterium]|nr:DeoR/GlpR transcriptional regulator [Actinomycetota bacterium]